MATYIFKRLLIMIPTFFAISVVVFVIINLAPGTPGEQKNTGGEGEEATGSYRQTWRIFKSQFHLDKPILFNTRFTIDRETVSENVHKAWNKASKKMGERLDAIEWLEDCAAFTVPHLLALAKEETDPELQAFMVQKLLENARYKITVPYGRELDEATKQRNKEAYEKNLLLKELAFPENASEQEKNQVLQAWTKWFDQNKENRYRYSTGDKVRIFFLETRFAWYWWNLLHLDFGISHVDKQPVFEKVLSKLKYSVSFAAPSLFLAYIVSVGLGIFSAIKRDSLSDKAITVVLFMLYSLPSFFVGTLLLFFFSTGSDYFTWFPTGGWQSGAAASMTVLEQIGDVLWHLVLPILCMSYGSLAVLSRYARTGLLEVINADYIRTARAKGVPESKVIFKHIVRNGMIPVITLLGTVLPILIGGSVIIEKIFNFPGIGLMTYNAILTRDYNTIMAVQLISAVLVMVGILISDILYALVDPRISFK